jgi:hypothetical protein
MAARQYVRKVSGYRKPSQANRAAFERAVMEVASATERLLGDLVICGASPAGGKETHDG